MTAGILTKIFLHALLTWLIMKQIQKTSQSFLFFLNLEIICFAPLMLDHVWGIFAYEYVQVVFMIGLFWNSFLIATGISILKKIPLLNAIGVSLGAQLALWLLAQMIFSRI